ncbi:transglutaminase domain protein [Caldicellulosiruptor saccharolyticus DSM 8903]|uniref:Transglutaminase domain protein n=1 Tax=Caldicellulosiruptor saccharolyticus (strain ATCC 43494 / DSM 8903 / Tp8T 6331) TaxID=351627 RepID=A4XGJ0_CALS8|nr:transglutaminase domain-containing protein [Caldicellulosiruptor saccharolyticus]ABP66025.1 transglutaminase domain protein [Caldicellulosiruptor saccharolyticus DSM 8903]
MDFLVCKIPEEIEREGKLGNFCLALRLIDRWLADERITEVQRKRLMYEKNRINRILESYPFDEETALKKAMELIDSFSREEFYHLLSEGYLDYIVVEGKRRFEERFVHNIAFALPLYRERLKKDPVAQKARELLDKRLEELTQGGPPKRYRVRAKITVTIKDDADHFRVWLPFPKEELQVCDVKLVSTNQRDYFLADNQVSQRTIYFEGKEKEYFVEFEYTINEWINKVDPEKVEENDLDEFLDEQPPHVVFTPYLKLLTNQVVAGENNPYLKAKRIFDWITKHVKYSYVRPYATYENISQYVAENLKGDCGFQALLFITMCRIAGIPARWQSGWYINPLMASPHDWALFYVKPYGWLPADLSFGGTRRENEKLRSFYFGNLDGFRMVANSDFMKDFVPKPNFLRFDPTDNQLGEAESLSGKVKIESKIEVISFEEI